MTAAAVLAAQLAALLVILVGSISFFAWRYRKKDRALRHTAEALDATVQFLQGLNEIPLGLPVLDLQQQLWNRLQNVLRPMGIRSRLWIQDSGWKTLRGFGGLPGHPLVAQHMPVTACPALAEKRLFQHLRHKTAECASEKFSYGKHLCFPLADDRQSFGVLFLASDLAAPWDPQETHLFHVLAQAIALSLQRRAMFDKLQEKISELHFSFEVGTGALSAFDGSTQSLDDTTDHILDAVISVLKVNRVSFMEWNPVERTLVTQRVRGERSPDHAPLTLKWGEGLAGWALQTAEPYWAEYATGDPHFAAGYQDMTSMLCVPVFTMTREPLGVINAVMLKQSRSFSKREVQFLTNLSRLAGMAIENARLHHTSRANIHHLNEVNQLKSEFLSLVSHDLRGPLTGIRGFAEILKLQTRGDLNAVQLEMLDQLERQVDHQERMVDDLLDLARMEKGRLSVYPKATDLGFLLKEETDKAALTAKERAIDLQLHLTDAARLSSVHVDAGRIRQVTWNLIHNALKFTPENGRVTVSALLTETHLVIEVQDTGAGLSPETQEKIFEKFFQVTPGGSKGAQGLGLGLAICKEIVQAHGGQIQAFSEGLGRGTRMRICLPLKTAHEQRNALAA